MPVAGLLRRPNPWLTEFIIICTSSGAFGAAIGLLAYRIFVPSAAAGDGAMFLLALPAIIAVIGALALTKLREHTRQVIARMEELEADLVHETEQRKRAESALEFHVEKDALTDVATARYFTTRAELAIARARRTNTPTTILLLGIDEFDRVMNDVGPVGADDVLRKIGKICRDSVREVDLPARLDGNVFAILLEDTTTEGALTVVNRMRDRIASTEEWTESGECEITAGVGVIEMSARDHFLNDALKWAREALDHARKCGSNKICIARDKGASDEADDGDNSPSAKIRKALARAA